MSIHTGGVAMQVVNSSRRSFMKWVAAAPLISQIAVADLYAKAATAVGKDPRQNVYSRLGVKTVINCRGTWTYLSGSLEFPEVRAAQVEAGAVFRECARLGARYRAAAGRTHRSRVWNDHLRSGRRHGGLNRRMHGGHRRQVRLAASRYNRPQA